MFSKRSDPARSGYAAPSQPVEPTAPTPAPTIGEARRGRSVILSDLVIQGAVLARGELELHGLVEGDVVARSVVVGPSATVFGDILGEKISISGAVQGRICGHQVHLGAEARYRGDIRRGVIAIDDGAEFEGSVRALDSADEAEIEKRLQSAAPGASPARKANGAGGDRLFAVKASREGERKG